jgi:hypothetical protein
VSAAVLWFLFLSPRATLHKPAVILWKTFSFLVGVLTIWLVVATLVHHFG